MPNFHLPPKECCFSDCAEVFFTSNFASKYSLSVMVNTGPRAHVCRPVCQQTRCLSGVHGHLLQAVTLRRTVPKPVLSRDTPYPEELLMEPDDSPNASNSVSNSFVHPVWRLSDFLWPLLLFLKGTLTQNTCSKLHECLMRSWSPSPTDTQKTQLIFLSLSLRQTPDQG